MISASQPLPASSPVAGLLPKPSRFRFYRDVERLGHDAVSRAPRTDVAEFCTALEKRFPDLQIVENPDLVKLHGCTGTYIANYDNNTGTIAYAPAFPEAISTVSHELVHYLQSHEGPHLLSSTNALFKQCCEKLTTARVLNRIPRFYHTVKGSDMEELLGSLSTPELNALKHYLFFELQANGFQIKYHDLLTPQTRLDQPQEERKARLLARQITLSDCKILLIFVRHEELKRGLRQPITSQLEQKSLSKRWWIPLPPLPEGYFYTNCRTIEDFSDLD